MRIATTPTAAAAAQAPAAQARVAQAPSAGSWRALDAGLWVARRDGRHLGSVQPGRRWLATDAEGEPIGAYRSFAEAQRAVEAPAAQRGAASGRAPGPLRRAVRRTLLGPELVAAVLGAAALVGSAGWAATGLHHL